MTAATRTRPTTTCPVFIRNFFAFIEDLEYLLEWPLSAEDIARHFGLRTSAAVEKRFERYNMTETELAERYRARKPGYCAECRLVEGDHRLGCSQFVPITRDHHYKLRRHALDQARPPRVRAKA